MTKIFNWKIFLFSTLFFFGFLLRIWGLLYQGNENYTDYRRLGHNVATYGLAQSYGTGYFPVAFIIFGIADRLGTMTPSNWWWPYKASNLVFEIAIVTTLLIYLKKHNWLVLFLFWLNPWFLIPPSWAGFWDAPYVVFILWAILALESSMENKYKFLLAGLFLGISSSIKPQTFAPLLTIGFYFLWIYFKKKQFKNFLIFSAALMSLPLFFLIFFTLNGKPILFLPKWYIVNTAWPMPNLVNSEVNIWHTVTRIIMYYQGMTGPIYSLNVTKFPYNILEYIAGITFFALLFLLIIKYLSAKKLPRHFFLKTFAFASMLLPQIGTRSHAYHFFPATLFLLILLILEWDFKFFILWLLSVGIHFYNIWWQYGLGLDLRNPVPLWGEEPAISILGFAQFLIILGLIYKFFKDPAK